MSRLIFYLLVLFLPSQLGKHFWPDSAFIQGLKIDYLSPTIYLTDIFIFGLFVSYLPKILSNLIRPGYLRNLWLIASATIFLFLVSFFALSPIISFFKLLKILELIFLGFYVSRELGKTISFKKTALLLSITVFYEAILAVWQFMNQSSIGGVWWFFGERTFNSETPGIARAIINAELLLRSYGTFPHPNVLGGYMAIILPIILFYILNTKHETLKTKSFSVVVFALGVIALFLSFSRTAWVAGSFGLITLLLFRTKKKIKVLVILLMVLFIGFVTTGNIIVSRLQTLEGVDNKSLVVRQQLNEVGLKMISDNPILGVGLNNFLIALPQYYQLKNVVRFYQPVHNIYLMIAAETGIVGFIIFIMFIILILRRLIHNTPAFAKASAGKNYLILLLLGEILFLGLFDHYLYTLQQGQLLFALVLGMAWSNKSRL